MMKRPETLNVTSRKFLPLHLLFGTVSSTSIPPSLWTKNQKSPKAGKERLVSSREPRARRRMPRNRINLLSKKDKDPKIVSLLETHPSLAWPLHRMLL
jgi:hypothetical protein